MALNAGRSEISLTLGQVAGAAAVLLATGRGRISPPRLAVAGGQATIQLPPRSGAVVSLS